MRRVLLVLLATALLPLPASSRDCVDCEDCLHWVGGVETPGGAYGVAVAGNHAYVAARRYGLQVIDVSEPEYPVLVGNVVTPGGARGVTVVGNHAYVADGLQGLQVIDISAPESPTIVGSVVTRDYALDVAVVGDYAYVAANYDGLQAIDVSVPESPKLVGRTFTAGIAEGVTVEGSYAYVAANYRGLEVVDISAPASPRRIGGVDTAGYSRDVAIVGNHAYVADRWPGVRVIDISVPESPRIVGGLDTPGSALGIAVAGNRIYVADEKSGLQVIGISVPEFPTLVGGLASPGVALGIAVVGNHIYVADLASGLQIAHSQCDDLGQEVTIDIRPGNFPNSINCKGVPGVVPVAILTTETFDALTIDHSSVRFGPGEAAEIHLRNVPKPNDPGAMSRKPIAGVSVRHEEDVDHDGDLDLVFHFARAETGIHCGDTEAVLTGQTHEGQSIFGIDRIQTVPDGGAEPPRTEIVQLSPNPFNPATSIAFVVSQPQHVTVQVFNVRGQLVSVLTDEAYPVGQHRLEWRGHDTSGRVVPSGIYYFRVAIGAQVESRRALLLK